MKWFIYVFLFFGTMSIMPFSEWAYSKAAVAAQKNDWDLAHSRMSDLVIDAPERPDVLYDAGVAAYKTENHESAHAYFEQAAHYAQQNDLKEQAYFNAGNAAVEINSLENAIVQYEKVLEINPENSYAQHNLEVVKQMLEQQQQQEQQEQQDDQQQDQDENKGDQNKSQDKDQSSDKGDNDSDQSDGDNDTGDQSEQQQDGDSRNDQERDGDQDSQENAQDQQAGDQQEGDDQKRDDQSGQNEKDKDGQDQKGDDHDQTPQQEKSSDGANDKNESEKKQENAAALAAENDDDLFQEGEQWMARLLRAREDADQQANKQMIKAMVNDKLAGHEGQRCW